MANNFYNDFDKEIWIGPRNTDYRSPFQQDRDRVIHSSAFRRLQAKTQVYLTGEYDFYRTRLTHSLEVAQIARGICGFLKQSSKDMSDNFYIDTDLVEAIGLSHDLGHPPFGHSGERELNRLMKKYGGFEGNAQSLRLLARIIFSNGITPSGAASRAGMSPTRALMDGVMKYKTLQSETPSAPNHFIYDDQKQCVDFVFAGRSIPAHLTPGEKLNNFRSIECQIMDWADDTAYCLNDLVDGVNAGFINKLRVEQWATSAGLSSTDSAIVGRLLNTMTKGVLTRDFSIKVGDFVRACKIVETTNFMSDLTNRYCYNLIITDGRVLSEHSIYKRLAKEVVFNSPQLHQLEFKGKHMIKCMFKAFEKNYVNSVGTSMLLPREVDVLVRRRKDPALRARLLCDHLSGMTDDFATRTYRRLFDPTYGSMVDLV